MDSFVTVRDARDENRHTIVNDNTRGPSATILVHAPHGAHVFCYTEICARHMAYVSDYTEECAPHGVYVSTYTEMCAPHRGIRCLLHGRMRPAQGVCDSRGFFQSQFHS